MNFYIPITVTCDHVTGGFTKGEHTPFDGTGDFSEEELYDQYAYSEPDMELDLFYAFEIIGWIKLPPRPSAPDLTKYWRFDAQWL